MNKTLPLITLLVLITGSFMPIFNPVSAADLVDNSWNTKTPMTYSRSNLGVIVADGKLYAIGGFTDYNTFSDTNERYDPKTDKWTTLTAMPTPRHSFGTVAYQDKIYCIGGIIYENGQWFTCKTNEVYDIATDSWSSKASTTFEGSIGRNWWSTIQIHVVDEKIFVINDGEVYLYDPVTDSWTEKTRAPHSGYIASAVMGNKIIVYIKMVNFMEFEAKTLMYDTQTDKWSEKKTQTLTTNINSVVVAGATTGLYAPQQVYVFIEGKTWAHEPVHDTWRIAKTVSTDYQGCNVAVLDDILYVIGGSTNSQYIPLNYGSTSDSSKPSDTSLTYLIIVITVILTIGILTTRLLYHFKKQKTKRQHKQHQPTAITKNRTCKSTYNYSLD